MYRWASPMILFDDLSFTSKEMISFPYLMAVALIPPPAKNPKDKEEPRLMIFLFVLHL